MRVEISPEPRRGSARSRTDSLRTERLLIDQIDSGIFAASSDKAFRVRQARDQSDFQLAEERKENDKELLREQSARDAVTAARQERRVRIAVRDTGRGMTEADLERIFNPYCKLGREERHGLGLGLYISKSMVQAHGGKIWAESRPGAGSTFFFTIPGAHGSRPVRTDPGKHRGN